MNSCAKTSCFLEKIDIEAGLKTTVDFTYMEPSKTSQPYFIQVFVDKPLAPTHQSKIQEKVNRAAKDILSKKSGNIFLRVDEKGEISESFTCSYIKKIGNTEFAVFIDVSAEGKKEEVSDLLDSLKESAIPKNRSFHISFKNGAISGSWTSSKPSRKTLHQRLLFRVDTQEPSQVLPYSGTQLGSVPLYIDPNSFEKPLSPVGAFFKRLFSPLCRVFFFLFGKVQGVPVSLPLLQEVMGVSFQEDSTLTLNQALSYWDAALANSPLDKKAIALRAALKKSQQWEVQLQKIASKKEGSIKSLYDEIGLAAKELKEEETIFIQNRLPAQNEEEQQYYGALWEVRKQENRYVIRIDSFDPDVSTQEFTVDQEHFSAGLSSLLLNRVRAPEDSLSLQDCKALFIGEVEVETPESSKKKDETPAPPKKTDRARFRIAKSLVKKTLFAQQEGVSPTYKALKLRAELDLLYQTVSNKAWLEIPEYRHLVFLSVQRFLDIIAGISKGEAKALGKRLSPELQEILPSLQDDIKRLRAIERQLSEHNRSDAIDSAKESPLPQQIGTAHVVTGTTAPSEGALEEGKKPEKKTKRPSLALPSDREWKQDADVERQMVETTELYSSDPKMTTSIPGKDVAQLVTAASVYKEYDDRRQSVAQQLSTNSTQFVALPWTFGSFSDMLTYFLSLNIWTKEFMEDICKDSNFLQWLSQPALEKHKNIFDKKKEHPDPEIESTLSLQHLLSWVKNHHDIVGTDMLQQLIDSCLFHDKAWTETSLRQNKELFFDILHKLEETKNTYLRDEKTSEAVRVMSLMVRLSQKLSEKGSPPQTVYTPSSLWEMQGKCHTPEEKFLLGQEVIRCFAAREHKELTQEEEIQNAISAWVYLNGFEGSRGDKDPVVFSQGRILFQSKAEQNELLQKLPLKFFEELYGNVITGKDAPTSLRGTRLSCGDYEIDIAEGWISYQGARRGQLPREIQEKYGALLQKLEIGTIEAWTLESKGEGVVEFHSLSETQPVYIRATRTEKGTLENVAFLTKAGDQEYEFFPVVFGKDEGIEGAHICLPEALRTILPGNSAWVATTKSSFMICPQHHLNIITVEVSRSSGKIIRITREKKRIFALNKKSTALFKNIDPFFFATQDKKTAVHFPRARWTGAKKEPLSAERTKKGWVYTKFPDHVIVGEILPVVGERQLGVGRLLMPTGISKYQFLEKDGTYKCIIPKLPLKHTYTQEIAEGGRKARLEVLVTQDTETSLEEMTVFDFDVDLEGQRLISKNPEANVYLAYLFFSQKRYEEAKYYLEKASLSSATSEACLALYEQIARWNDPSPEGWAFHVLALAEACKLQKGDSDLVLRLRGQFFHHVYYAKGDKPWDSFSVEEKEKIAEVLDFTLSKEFDFFIEDSVQPVSAEEEKEKEAISQGIVKDFREKVEKQKKALLQSIPITEAPEVGQKPEKEKGPAEVPAAVSTPTSIFDKALVEDCLAPLPEQEQLGFCTKTEVTPTLQPRVQELQQDIRDFEEERSKTLQANAEKIADIKDRFAAAEKDFTQKAHELEATILRTVNPTPPSTLEKLRLARGPKRRLSMDTLLGAYIRGDQELETLLKSHGITVSAEHLSKQLQQFLLLSTQRNQAHEVVTKTTGLLKQASPLLSPQLQDLGSSIEAKRYFSIDEKIEKDARVLLVLEYQNGFLTREGNIKLVKDFIHGKSTVRQLPPGTGKTTVVLRLLATLRADGNQLSTIILPESLYATQAADLDRNLKELTGQEIFFLEVEPGKHVTTADIDFWLQETSKTIRKKGVMISTPSSLLSLRNLFQYYERRVREAEQPSIEDIEMLQKLASLLHIFREKVIAIADEVDSLSDIHHEVNLKAGKEEKIPQSTQQACAQLYKLLLQHRYDKNALGELCRALLRNQQTECSDTVLKEAMNLLAKAYLEDKKVDLTALPWLLSQKDACPALDCLDKRLHDELVSARMYLSSVLPSVAFKSKSGAGGGYGKHAGNKVGPYVRTNTPAKGSEFSNPEGLVAFTVQEIVQNGISIEQAKIFFEKKIQAAKKEQQEKLIRGEPCASLGDTSVMKGLIQYGLSPSLSLDSFHKIVDAVNQDFDKRRLFVQEEILPTLSTFPEQYRSTCYDLVEMCHSFCGMSGTLSNKQTFHDSIDLEGSRMKGGDGKTLAALIEQQKGMKIYQVEEKEGAPLSNTIFEQAAAYDGVIDIGVCCMAKSCQKAALDMAKATRSPVVFIDEGGETRVALSDGTATIFSEESYPPETRKTLYQVFVGADITQKPDARFLVTIGNDMFIDDLIQGVMRLRKLALNQRVDFVFSAETEKTIREISGKKEGKITLDDLFIYCLANEERTLPQDIFSADRQKRTRAIETGLHLTEVDEVSSLTLPQEQEKRASKAKEISEKIKKADEARRPLLESPLPPKSKGEAAPAYLQRLGQEVTTKVSQSPAQFRGRIEGCLPTKVRSSERAQPLREFAEGRDVAVVHQMEQQEEQVQQVEVQEERTVRATAAQLMNRKNPFVYLNSGNPPETFYGAKDLRDSFTLSYWDKKFEKGRSLYWFYSTNRDVFPPCPLLATQNLLSNAQKDATHAVIVDKKEPGYPLIILMDAHDYEDFTALSVPEGVSVTKVILGKESFTDPPVPPDKPFYNALIAKAKVAAGYVDFRTDAEKKGLEDFLLMEVEGDLEDWQTPFLKEEDKLRFKSGDCDLAKACKEIAEKRKDDKDIRVLLRHRWELVRQERAFFDELNAIKSVVPSPGAVEKSSLAELHIQFEKALQEWRPELAKQLWQRMQTKMLTFQTGEDITNLVMWLFPEELEVSNPEKLKEFPALFEQLKKDREQATVDSFVNEKSELVVTFVNKNLANYFKVKINPKTEKSFNPQTGDLIRLLEYGILENDLRFRANALQEKMTPFTEQKTREFGVQRKDIDAKIASAQKVEVRGVPSGVLTSTY